MHEIYDPCSSLLQNDGICKIKFYSSLEIRNLDLHRVSTIIPYTIELPIPLRDPVFSFLPGWYSPLEQTAILRWPRLPWPLTWLMSYWSRCWRRTEAVRPQSPVPWNRFYHWIGHCRKEDHFSSELQTFKKKSI